MACDNICIKACSGEGSLRAQQVMHMRSDPMECLHKLNGITVKEKVRLLEAVSAMLGNEIEMANMYRVTAKGGGWDEKFAGLEKTSWFAQNMRRMCCDCVPWTVDIMYREGMGEEKAFRLERPMHFQCCCFCRPTCHVYDVLGNELGTISDNWDCFDVGKLSFDIRDHTRQHILKIESAWCPLGYYCPLPCFTTFRDIEMPITEMMTGRRVGLVTKRVPSLFKFLFAGDVDDYHVDWKHVQYPQHKALLMAATMFIDMQCFNDNPNDNKSGGYSPLGAGMR